MKHQLYAVAIKIVPMRILPILDMASRAKHEWQTSYIGIPAAIDKVAVAPDQTANHGKVIPCGFDNQLLWPAIWQWTQAGIQKEQKRVLCLHGGIIAGSCPVIVPMR